MISSSALGRIGMIFIPGKSYRSLFRNISKSSTDDSVSAVNVKVENDMPIQIENPYVKKKEKCILCKFDIEPDYKNVRLLSQFQSRHTGRIYGRHITGLCKHKQMRVEQEIMKAQSAGLLGIWTKAPEYVNDPQLFDPNYPFRPHKY